MKIDMCELATMNNRLFKGKDDIQYSGLKKDNQMSVQHILKWISMKERYGKRNAQSNWLLSRFIKGLVTNGKRQGPTYQLNIVINVTNIFFVLNNLGRLPFICVIYCVIYFYKCGQWSRTMNGQIDVPRDFRRTNWRTSCSRWPFSDSV